MIEWAKDNKAIMIILLLLGGFIILAAFEKSSASESSSGKDIGMVDSSSPMARGDANAKIDLVQYSDFLCPSCSYVSTQVMPTIEKKYIAEGKVKFEFRPMAFIAPGSTQAGVGAYCAVDQGKFWPYHDGIYGYVADKVFNSRLDPTRDTILTADIIKDLAARSGLDQSAFSECMDSQKHLSSIGEATRTANKNGVTGTPYIIVNGQPVTGNPSLQTIEALIKTNL